MLDSTNRTTVAVTGYSGFIGKQLLLALRSHEFDISLIGRSEPNVVDLTFYKRKLSSHQDYSDCLKKCEVIIHLAGISRAKSKNSKDLDANLLEVNTYATLNLAKQAAKAGVKRFIFISSLKVNGEQTKPNEVYKYDDIPSPQDSYAVSKHQAEIGLKHLADTTNMEIVIIRPPMVYGPGVKGNFAFMLKMVKANIPLPFKLVIQNKRSLVSIQNLIDIILNCIHNNNAANRTFLVSDGVDLSTAALFSHIYKALGKKNMLVPFPVSLLNSFGTLFGKKQMLLKLTSSLVVDIQHTRSILGWTPNSELEEMIKYAVLDTRVKND